MTTTEILTGIKNWVLSKLNLKQDVINDLAAIRSGSQAGSTAVQPSDLSSYFNDASYDTSTHRINFYHGQNIVAYVDASPFIVDGMVDDVRIENGYLVIDFNTASGKQDISIPLTDIFDPSNYYNKTQTDTLLGNKVDKVSGKGLSTNDYTNTEKEKLSGLQNYDDTQVRQLITQANANFANYYTKSESYSAAEMDEALGGKQNTINDLANIRSGAEAGSTAVQPSVMNTALANTVAESGVYDVTANNNNTKFASLSALLSSQNLDTLIPPTKRKGGMSIKFVLSSDNKYVQFRYMPSDATTAATFTNVANWQGVDNEPIAGSDNLVKSGGVYAEAEKKANIDGYYETMGVGTADNLTGQTERTNDAMYRKTGGSEEVASGIAELVSVKGNTVAWNQLCTLNDIDNNYYRLSNGILTVKYEGKTTWEIIQCTVSNNCNIINGHKYFCRSIPAKVNLGNVLMFNNWTDSIVQPLNKSAFIFSATKTVTTGDIRIRTQSNYNLGSYPISLIDLTLIYGEGNEPSTTEEFEADYFKWFGKPLTYEPYDEGSLRSVQLDALKTTGFNQYNNGQARVIGGLQYQITGTYTKLYPTVALIDYTYGDTVTAGTYYTNDNNHFVGVKNVSTYDNTKTYALGEYCAYNGAIYKSNVAIETAEEFDATHWDIIADVAAMVTEGILTLWDIIPDANGLFTPSTTGTLTIVGGGNDTCIHISGDRNGEYEPYEEHSVSLPVTTITGKLNGEGESVVVFPDGMKSAGSVYDEIYTVGDKTYAVKRIGSVDMGSLHWWFSSLRGNIWNCDDTCITSMLKQIPNNFTKPNMITSIYSTVTYIGKIDKTIGQVSTTNEVFIRDSSYNSADNPIVPHLQGVMLYYELSAPEVYELDTFDLPTRYQVDSNGTEEQIQKSGVQGLAAILTCIYGVDAVKILDKLPQNYISEKSMDNFLAQLNNVTGGTWTKTWNDNTGEWDFSFTPNAQTNDTNIEETI